MNKRQKKKKQKREMERKTITPIKNIEVKKIVIPASENEERKIEVKEEYESGKAERLYRKKEEVIDEMIFDQHNFQWKIYHHTDGEPHIKEFCIGVYENTKLSPETAEKVKIYKRDDIDKNLIYALAAFDNYHSNSTSLRDCLTDSLKCKITYDLTRKPKNMQITKYKIEEIKEAALEEKRTRGAKVKRYRNRVIKAALIGLSLIIGMASFGPSLAKKHRSEDEEDTSTRVIYETEEESLTTEIEQIANTTIEEALEATTTYENTTQEEITTEETQKEDTEPEVIEEKEKVINNDIKLMDSFNLEDEELVDDTRNPIKKAYTTRLKCDDYRIALTAVLVDNKIVAIDGVEELENLSLKEIENNYKEKYGKNAQVYVNFNGYKDGKQVYKYIGWGHIYNYKNMKTTETRNEISNLKQLKNMLLSSSNQKTYVRK